MADRNLRWLVLTTSLSGRSASTARVRLWRALKGLGATTLRDGVTLLPASDDHQEKLAEIGKQVEAEGGTTWLFELPTQTNDNEERLYETFDRSEAYQELQASKMTLRSGLPQLDEATARRQLRQLERDFEAVVRIDFFPGKAKTQSSQSLEELAALINRRFSPQEPTAATGDVVQLDSNHYRQRLWATRKQLWVDRMASAWVIRRFIDVEARFLWLDRLEDCPDEALGFDFDGAVFTHVGDQVTFEVLLASFKLETDRGLAHLGRLVHYLDVGGVFMDEAAGFEAVLAGLRENATNDDALLDAVTPVLDALYRRFSVTAT